MISLPFPTFKYISHFPGFVIKCNDFYKTDLFEFNSCKVDLINVSFSDTNSMMLGIHLLSSLFIDLWLPTTLIVTPLDKKNSRSEATIYSYQQQQ